ncbi:Iron-sulfur cluster carrier protein [subsurface metagenome]
MKAIGIGAVKGGVGKTFISLNIARKLAEHGKVALLDADLDNSSFSQFTGSNASITLTDDHRFEPYRWNGVDVFSMSLVTERTQSISMESSRYAQMLHDIITRTNWKPEYFLVDLPGGSSDVFRTVMEILADNMAGNIIICQPLMKDATEKFLHLHEYLEVPVLGLIENMSYFKGGSMDYYPFGRSTVDEIAAKYNVPVLGKIPLSMEVAENVHKGLPYLPEELEGPIIRACEEIQAAQIQRPGFVSRLADKISAGLKGQVEKVMTSLIVTSNKTFDISALRTSTGFRDKKPFLLLITDESRTKEITRVALRFTEDSIKVLRNPEELDFGIETDYRTLARMIMRKRKMRNGDFMKYSAWDGWCHGDIRGFGIGHAPRAVRAIREIFENDQIIEALQARMGGVLERWI